MSGSLREAAATGTDRRRAWLAEAVVFSLKCLLVSCFAYCLALQEPVQLLLLPTGAVECGQQLQLATAEIARLRTDVARVADRMDELRRSLEQSGRPPMGELREIRPQAQQQRPQAQQQKPQAQQQKPQAQQQKPQAQQPKHQSQQQKPQSQQQKPHSQLDSSLSAESAPAAASLESGASALPIRIVSESDRQNEGPLLLRTSAGVAQLRGIRPKKIFQDGRRIPPVRLERILQSQGSSVQVYMFEEFLSDAECDGLAGAHARQVDRVSTRGPIVCFDSADTLRRLLRERRVRRTVTTADFVEGTRCLDSSLSAKMSSWLGYNWTVSSVFYPGESRFSLSLSSRLLKAMGLPESHAGPIELTSHPGGVGHASRLDCQADSRAFATVRVFLDTVSQGGEFHLPKLGIWLRPRKGRALLVTNMSPEGACEPAAAYNSSQVISGRRLQLTQRFFYEDSDRVAKRPVEPELPPRSPGTPLVYCDSVPPCRWYDTWGDAHLVKEDEDDDIE